jgi:hypothetical protein
MLGHVRAVVAKQGIFSAGVLDTVELLNLLVGDMGGPVEPGHFPRGIVMVVETVLALETEFDFALTPKFPYAC